MDSGHTATGRSLHPQYEDARRAFDDLNAQLRTRLNFMLTGFTHVPDNGYPTFTVSLTSRQAELITEALATPAESELWMRAVRTAWQEIKAGWLLEAIRCLDAVLMQLPEPGGEARRATSEFRAEIERQHQDTSTANIDEPPLRRAFLRAMGAIAAEIMGEP